MCLINYIDITACATLQCTNDNPLWILTNLKDDCHNSHLPTHFHCQDPFLILTLLCIFLPVVRITSENIHEKHVAKVLWVGCENLVRILWVAPRETLVIHIACIIICGKLNLEQLSEVSWISLFLIIFILLMTDFFFINDKCLFQTIILHLQSPCPCGHWSMTHREEWTSSFYAFPERTGWENSQRAGWGHDCDVFIHRENT